MIRALLTAALLLPVLCCAGVTIAAHQPPVKADLYGKVAGIWRSQEKVEAGPRVTITIKAFQLPLREALRDSSVTFSVAERTWK